MELNFQRFRVEDLISKCLDEFDAIVNIKPKTKHSHKEVECYERKIGIAGSMKVNADECGSMQLDKASSSTIHI